MRAARRGLGEDSPAKQELIELIADEFFPGNSRAKTEIRRIVIFQINNYDIPRYTETLKDNAGTIREQLAKDIVEHERFKGLTAQVNHLLYLADR